mmetsp:Transcript_34748/g.86976  ORF Transcript_34748/g.86976 Transcript_34748/m.86976 type:complete len:340 (-) Transcript_34748:539-1558(-)
MSTSEPNGMTAVWAARMAIRCAWEGIPTAISRSSRPGRRIAGSSALGRLVVPTTRRCPGEAASPAAVARPAAAPSSSVRSCATTRPSCARPLLRRGASASTSSSSTTTVLPSAAAASAAANASRSRLSDSPWKAPKTAAAVTVCSSAPHSRASAVTAEVLPVPEGPCSRTPRGHRTPRCAACARKRDGHSMSSRSAASTLSIPPSFPSAGGPRRATPSPSSDTAARPSASPSAAPAASAGMVLSAAPTSPADTSAGFPSPFPLEPFPLLDAPLPPLRPEELAGAVVPPLRLGSGPSSPATVSRTSVEGTTRYSAGPAALGSTSATLQPAPPWRLSRQPR